MIKAYVAIGKNAEGGLKVISMSANNQEVVEAYKKLRDSGGGGYVEIARGQFLVDILSKHSEPEPQELKPQGKTKVSK